MSPPTERSGVTERRGPIRSPQSFVAGLALLALAAFALWLTRELPQGTLRAMGPAMLPRWLAIGVGLSGLALAALGFLKVGDSLEHWSLRGLVFVMLAVLAFAVTIRPFAMGPLTVPGLGLVVAGPLGIIIGGYATPEARLRELVVLGLSLTAGCMLLFGDLLNLPIPIFPHSLAGLFPDGWSQKDILRATAAILLLGAVAVFFLSGGRRTRHSSKVEVAVHSESL